MNAKPIVTLARACLAGTCLLLMSTAHSAVPDNIKVPDGHKIALQTVGIGEITYECRAKADSPEQTEWVFVGPNAVLKDRSGKAVGRYFGPPATWQAEDGSKVTGTQLAVAPSSPGNLPYQLVKANPAEGQGAMTGVTYIQRVALKGGVAPTSPCGAAQKGSREVVNYQADYIFWAAQ
ncbi:DUF3455 domain-containing protein [Pseudomonas rubra]|uniref:DUF3455 domain-containing protein n=1 Tax=Pseudomonas rubra TaxID=2942627 RepID=A0ABT5P9Y2_9PSED|nr:DUF3455 domain-containing protein [Pseudomonas rubra]MDD1015118.1 DUF3455 domain-containing protein [Pseudomonas rubra]MDD1037697.1 DUF3455 domain-containing protein [Pseudomonas rubra]MDD1157383.1 DUF3455 domain-containing protein [Pseudomonas rubra]